MQIVRNNMQPGLVRSDRQHPVGVGTAGQHVAAAGPREWNMAARAGRSRLERAREPSRPSDGDGRRPLSGNDFALMAVLGIVYEGYERAAEILPAAKSLARPDWQPTVDVLAAALEKAVAERLLVLTTAGYAITAQGVDRLAALIRAPWPSARGAAARTCTALKVCFLGAVDHRERETIIDDLVLLHEEDLAALIEGCAGCPASGNCTRLWIAREVARIRSEIDWLGELKALVGADG